MRVEEGVGERVRLRKLRDRSCGERRVVGGVWLGGIEMVMRLEIEEGVEWGVNMDEKGRK